MEVAGQHHAPAALLPEKTRYSLYRRLGGPQGRSGRVWKISPPPEFDPPTVQPVASRYTNHAVPAAISLCSADILMLACVVLTLLLVCIVLTYHC